MMTTATGLLVNDALYDFDLVDDHIRSSNYQIHSFCCTSYMCYALPHLDLDVHMATPG